MSFLQPTLLLFALPVIALPIVIHLINQRRYQTVRWGAMMFLLAANRMSRGYARIRQWLILAARMLAIAGLVFVLGRPLAGGLLGLAAGARSDATIVILDRSPSMQQAGEGSGSSKLDAGRQQIAATLKLLGPTRLVVIDGKSSKPRELETVDGLLTSPDLGPEASSADLPAMLQSARDYIEANKAGRVDVWIVSDLRANDWDADSGRWPGLREAFLGLAQRARFHLLAYPQEAPGNLSVRVTRARRVESGEGGELLVSLRLAREGAASEGGEGRASVPVRFEIDGARSEVVVEMTGREAELKDHRIPLQKGQARGWGKVAIPADANPADDAAWFAFDRPRPRLAVVVAEDAEAARPLQLAASIAPDPAIACASEVVGGDQLTGIAWDDLALLIWQAPLPEGEPAKLVKAYIERGGRAIFFPPKSTGGAGFLGQRWAGRVEGKPEVAVDSWRGDQGLLANTEAGAPLPVGQLGVRRYCKLEGESTALATLKGGSPLLARVATDRGGAYFCATGAGGKDSSLATSGVAFYVMIQRALADGAGVLESTRSLAAGDPAGEDPKGWTRLVGTDGVLSTDYANQAGVYASGDRLIGVNRPAAEDRAAVLPPSKVAGLFEGLDFARVDDSADNASSLVQEIWRLFLVAMMAALVVEAGLCLPKRTTAAGPGGLR